jgi:hypothetical protein
MKKVAGLNVPFPSRSRWDVQTKDVHTETLARIMEVERQLSTRRLYKEYTDEPWVCINTESREH